MCRTSVGADGIFLKPPAGRHCMRFRPTPSFVDVASR